jgi:hypothetical protein
MAQSSPDAETDHDAQSSAEDDTADGEPAGASGDDVAETAADESQWEFGLDEVGPDGIVDSEPEPLEPGQPRLESVFFVLLGVVGTLLLLSTVV